MSKPQSAHQKLMSEMKALLDLGDDALISRIDN